MDAKTKYNHSIRDVMNVAALKVRIPAWEGYRWKLASGGSLVDGCVPDGVYRSGPKKGRPRFNKPKVGTFHTVIVSDLDMDNAAENYERAVGKCWECKGTGQVFAGWNHETGTRYSPCRKCAPLPPPPTSTDGAE